MPANFPEQWLNRVINNIVQNTQAPWLNGIPEIDTSVIEVASGAIGEKNVIHVSTSDFAPTVFLNNTTYPLGIEQYTDGEVLISLDKYNTAPTSVSDDKIIGGAYSIIDNVTRKHTDAILKTKYMKAAHAIAPSNSASTPVTICLGDGSEASGERLRFTYKTLLKHKDDCDKAGMPQMGRRLVLCSDHWNDLLADRGYFADAFVDYKNGKVLNVLGFEVYEYLGNPYYNTAGTTKLAWGATPTAGQYQASFSFVPENIAIKTGMTKQYFKDARNDPENQTNLLNYRHYFIVLPFQTRYLGAITSKNKA